MWTPTVSNLFGLLQQEGGSKGETDWCFIQSDELSRGRLSKQITEWTEYLTEYAWSKCNEEHTER